MPTTIDEYRKYIEKDAALERRFQPIIVAEPNEEDSISIFTRLNIGKISALPDFVG